jgi:hypothetical protein
LFLLQEQIPEGGLAIVEELAAATSSLPPEIWDAAIENVAWLFNIFVKHLQPGMSEERRSAMCLTFAALIDKRLRKPRN